MLYRVCCCSPAGDNYSAGEELCSIRTAVFTEAKSLFSVVVSQWHFSSATGHVEYPASEHLLALSESCHCVWLMTLRCNARNGVSKKIRETSLRSRSESVRQNTDNITWSQNVYTSDDQRTSLTDCLRRSSVYYLPTIRRYLRSANTPMCTLFPCRSRTLISMVRQPAYSMLISAVPAKKTFNRWDSFPSKVQTNLQYNAFYTSVSMYFGLIFAEVCTIKIVYLLTYLFAYMRIRNVVVFEYVNV